MHTSHRVHSPMLARACAVADLRDVTEGAEEWGRWWRVVTVAVGEGYLRQRIEIHGSKLQHISLRTFNFLYPWSCNNFGIITANVMCLSLFFFLLILSFYGKVKTN